MEAKHTQTPWTLTHVAGSNFAVQEFEIRGMFGDKHNVSPIFNKDRSAINGTTVFMHPDDAAFIHRAVNAHDDLVKALQDCVSMLEAFAGSEENSEGAVTEQLREARTTLALARAGA